ncbi:hypothetical protein M758_UG269800 [Ceratodon purpureus]|nr:hypothetical protein M758_UG269800 [Ceratodon purpureus]
MQPRSTLVALLSFGLLPHSSSVVSLTSSAVFAIPHRFAPRVFVSSPAAWTVIVRFFFRSLQPNQYGSPTVLTMLLVIVAICSSSRAPCWALISQISKPPNSCVLSAF